VESELLKCRMQNAECKLSVIRYSGVTLAARNTPQLRT
jgi:hypothetical protein